MILTTEKGSRDGGCDAGEVQLEAGLVRVLRVRGEGVEDRGHDHADLVAADHDQDDAELLPRGPARDRRRHEVPQEERQEEEEAEEMCPDVERLVVEGEDGAETLRPTLSRSVPATNQHRHRDKSILSPPIIAAMCVVVVVLYSPCPDIGVSLEVFWTLVILQQRLAVAGEAVGDQPPHALCNQCCY